MYLSVTHDLDEVVVEVLPPPPSVPPRFAVYEVIESGEVHILKVLLEEVVERVEGEHLLVVLNLLDDLVLYIVEGIGHLSIKLYINCRLSILSDFSPTF